ncbi:unnamed protein product [Somion occarium]|uniref:Uncharacterized protein n=1 Tax=Somion occarium TaxID=3059160 RepID=A0ABP1E6H9_9APHY
MSPIDKFQLPSVQQNVIEQIRSLKFDHRIIHDDFICVQRSLEGVSTCVRWSKLKRCQQMIIAWKGLHQDYISLVWKSKDVAGMARSTAIDFVDVVIPTILQNAELSIEQKMDTMHDYMKHLENDGKESKSLTDGFLKLKRDVDVFCNQWNDLIKEHRLLRLVTQSKKCEQRLVELDAQLKPLQFKIAALKIAVQVVTATRTLISLMDGSAMGRTAGGDVAPTRLKQALSEADLEIQNLRQKNARHLQDVQELDTQSTEHKIRDIAAKLGVIVSVWAAIVADLTLVSGLLEHAVRSPENPTLQGLFNGRLKQIHNHYRGLAEVFHEFQVALNDTSLPALRRSRERIL